MPVRITKRINRGRGRARCDTRPMCFLCRRDIRNPYLSADRKRTISLYQAPDAESVRLALQAASVPVERVWAFRQFSG